MATGACKSVLAPRQGLVVESGEHAYSRRRTLSNAKIYLVGKVCSAGLTVAWLALLVRLLDLPDYAAYVAAMAMIEAGIAFSSLGIEWLLIRYIPEYIVQGALRRLGGLVLRALAVRLLGGLLVVGLGFGVGQLWPQSALKLEGDLLLILALLLLSEACMRLLRENALESLGQQRLTQLGVMLRTGVALVAAYACHQVFGALSIRDVLLIELGASVLVLAYALVAVRHSVVRTGQGLAQPSSPDWHPPAFFSMFKNGLNNYVSSLISFPLSLQAMVLMVSTLGGSASVVAGFGFMIRILEIMRGYLPALMLMSVLRPRFIGLYAQTHSLVAVAREAALASRLSALTVAPLIGVIGLYGDQLLALASGGKIVEGRWVLAALTLTLMARVHRQISVVLVNCVDLSRLLLVAAGLAACVLLPAWLVATQGHADWAAVLAVAWDEVVWVGVMVWGLQRAGHPWASDWFFMLKLALFAGLSAYGVALLPLDAAAPVQMILGCILLLFLFAGAVLATRTFLIRDLAVLRR